MTKYLLIFALCCVPSFAADRLPEASDGPAPVATAPAAKPAVPPDINAVLTELLKRMPTPADIKTSSEKESWNETLQTISKELVALVGAFLTVWKLLHDHHDRVDNRVPLPTPTADEQKVLDKFKVAATVTLLFVCGFFLQGCGEHRCQDRPCVQANCPGETHGCYFTKDGKQVCR